MNRAPSSEPLAQVTKFERFLIINKRKLMFASFLIGLAFTALILGSPQHEPDRYHDRNTRMQTARQIGQLLNSYAVDHDGKYPVGKSSTDIFQQLIEQGYATDPKIFYFAMPGKTIATTNKLRPENVCYAITTPIQDDDPDTLPLVMSTGYKIDYVQGGKAHLLANGDPYGIAVFFKSNHAAWLKPGPDGIPLFPPAYVSADTPPFDPKGRTYQQLTPDGSLR